MDEQNKTNLNKSTEAIHTYAGDMANLVREDEASVIKIAMAEQRRREKEKNKNLTATKNNMSILFFIIAIILIVGGIFGIRFLNQRNKINSVHPEVLSQVPTFIPVDTQKQLPADQITGREDIARVIDQERATTNTEIIESIVFTIGGQKTLTASEFLDKVGSSIPSAFKRTLDPNVTIGIYRQSPTATPHTFFIFKSSSYEQAVAGSYAWEKTLLDEFSTLFGIDVTGEKKILLERSFEDTVINNTDARILNDDNKQPLLYSLFLSQNLYMISDSKEVVIEAVKRLRTQNAKPL